MCYVILCVISPSTFTGNRREVTLLTLTIFPINLSDLILSSRYERYYTRRDISSPSRKLKISRYTFGQYDLITTDINSIITPGYCFATRSSPPRTRRSSASSVGSVQNLQSAQLHAPPRSISSNRSRSPTPHRPTAGNKQQHQQQSCDEQKKRSRSPTPHRKLLASPNHQPDLVKQRSRSPTPRANLRSRSPTPRKSTDSSRRNANEEARSPTYYGKPQENGRVSLSFILRKKLFLEKARYSFYKQYCTKNIVNFDIF